MINNHHQHHHYEEPIGESTIVHLDHHFGSKMLTNVYRTSARFDSQLISFFQFHQLFKCELRSVKPPKLLYRASRDGYGFQDFHTRCDDKLKIVIIVKSKDGDLFGGYTTQNLRADERGTNVRDDDSFTFRFDDGKLYIFRLLADDSIHALYRYSNTYFFAFGYCFWVCDNATTSTMSSSHNATEEHIRPEGKLPKKVIDYSENFSDEMPGLIEVEDTKPRRYFGGENFLITDLEAYQIMDE